MAPNTRKTLGNGGKLTDGNIRNLVSIPRKQRNPLTQTKGKNTNTVASRKTPPTPEHKQKVNKMMDNIGNKGWSKTYSLKHRHKDIKVINSYKGVFFTQPKYAYKTIKMHILMETKEKKQIYVPVVFPVDEVINLELSNVATDKDYLQDRKKKGMFLYSMFFCILFILVI